MDQEFDLQGIVLALLRRWRLIVTLMLIAAIFGGVSACRGKEVGLCSTPPGWRTHPTTQVNGYLD